MLVLLLMLMMLLWLWLLLLRPRHLTLSMLMMMMMMIIIDWYCCLNSAASATPVAIVSVEAAVFVTLRPRCCAVAAAVAAVESRELRVVAMLTPTLR
jgi:hypothetical protein